MRCEERREKCVCNCSARLVSTIWKTQWKVLWCHICFEFFVFINNLLDVSLSDGTPTRSIVLCVFFIMLLLARESFCKHANRASLHPSSLWISIQIIFIFLLLLFTAQRNTSTALNALFVIRKHFSWWLKAYNDAVRELQEWISIPVWLRSEFFVVWKFDKIFLKQK